jgi:hypothetical protein
MLYGAQLRRDRVKVSFSSHMAYKKRSTAFKSRSIAVKKRLSCGATAFRQRSVAEKYTEVTGWICEVIKLYGLLTSLPLFDPAALNVDQSSDAMLLLQWPTGNLSLR